MTATQTLDLHSNSAGGRPSREMPVLFHLLDVSRPKGYSAIRAVEAPPETESIAGDANTASDSMSLAATEVVSESEVITPNMPVASAASDVQHVAAPNLDAASPAVTMLAATASEAATSPPSPDSLRQRREQRSRRGQTQVKEDWFGLHGKYIAIGFVLALVATIYFARFHRRAPAPPVASQPHAHPGVAADTGPLVVEIPAGKPAEASPAVVATAPPEAAQQPDPPQVELHPPTQVAEQKPAAVSSEKSDSALFPWANREEQRVAERPAPPADEPRYPTTGQRSQFQPSMPPAPATDVPADGAFVPPGATSAPSGGAFVPPASSEPLYPTTNTASGIRYERTGSGLY